MSPLLFSFVLENGKYYTITSYILLFNYTI